MVRTPVGISYLQHHVRVMQAILLQKATPTVLPTRLTGNVVQNVALLRMLRVCLPRTAIFIPGIKYVSCGRSSDNLHVRNQSSLIRCSGSLPAFDPGHLEEHVPHWKMDLVPTPASSHSGAESTCSIHMLTLGRLRSKATSRVTRWRADCRRQDYQSKRSTANNPKNNPGEANWELRPGPILCQSLTENWLQMLPESSIPSRLIRNCALPRKAQ